MKYCYHIHAMYQNTPQTIQHFDGIVQTDQPIANIENYQLLKRNMAKTMNIAPECSEQININSLTPLPQ